MTDLAPPPVTPSRWVLAIAIVAIAAIAVALVPPSGHTSGSRGADETPSTMLAVAPGGMIDLAALPAEHRVLYRAAAADHEAFENVACYCGCESFLEHRHLLDCFERPAGGWERHATGCAVCLAEARDVIDMRRDGIPLSEITRTIDIRFGGFSDTTTA
jgi:hypothetical protein